MATTATATIAGPQRVAGSAARPGGCAPCPTARRWAGGGTGQQREARSAPRRSRRSAPTSSRCRRRPRSRPAPPSSAATVARSAPPSAHEPPQRDDEARPEHAEQREQAEQPELSHRLEIERVRVAQELPQGRRAGPTTTRRSRRPRPARGCSANWSSALSQICQRPLPFALSRCALVKSALSMRCSLGGSLKSLNFCTGSTATQRRPASTAAPAPASRERAPVRPARRRRRRSPSRIQPQ